MQIFFWLQQKKAKHTLLEEGILAGKIFITGNTIVDLVYSNLNLAKRKSRIPQKLNLKRRSYFLIAGYRRENVDKKEGLGRILRGLKLVYKRSGLPILYPVHPRGKKNIKEFRLRIPLGVELLEPVGFLDFLQLEASTRLILADSGGVQQEASVLQVPCVTLRDNIERIETLKVGSNTLSGTSPENIVESVEKMLKTARNWRNPFGSGTAGKKIFS